MLPIVAGREGIVSADRRAEGTGFTERCRCQAPMRASGKAVQLSVAGRLKPIAKMKKAGAYEAALLASRLAYHLRCLREDATNPDLPALERLALVRDRAARIREIRVQIEAANRRARPN